jgi:hypothetical protein
MKKIEFLSASLPYGLMFFYAGSDGYFNGDSSKDDYNQIETLFSINNLGYCQDERANEIDDRFKPIIRHLDTLTKECVQSDYNDGKPFFPIVELAKTAYPKCNKFDITKDGNVNIGQGYTFHIYKCDFDCRRGFNGKTWDYHCFVPNQLELFQLLLKFHFWPNKPESEEVVYVSEEFNPYK